jgi:hypothetical protein
LPQRMPVFETGEVEIGAAIHLPKCVQRAPVEPRAGRRQQRTRWKRGGHPRYVAGNAPPVNHRARKGFAWRAEMFR